MMRAKGRDSACLGGSQPLSVALSCAPSRQFDARLDARLRFCPVLTKCCNTAKLPNAMEARTTFITVQKRGVISLPPDLRKRHHLNEVGAQVELAEREDGVIELRPKVPVAAEQRWFWTDRWQKMEREADADIKAGRVKRFDTAEDFIADLDSADD